MYWRSRNLSALYVWLFGPFTPVNSRVTRGDTVQQAIEKMQGQLDAAGVGLDDTVTEESSNAVKSGGIWTWVKGLFTTHTTEANAHPATAISVDTSEFGGNLDETVNTVQKLATAVDELEASPVITEPLTPSNDAVAVGDGFQKIGEKVAGLQDGVIWEEVFEHDITTFELSVDKDGKQLDERGVLILVDGVVSSTINSGTLRLNSIVSSTYWNSVTNGIIDSAIIYCNGVADNIFSGTIQCYKNNNNVIIQQFIGNSISTTGGPRTSFYTASLPVSQNITNISLFALRWRAGSKIKIYRL